MRAIATALLTLLLLTTTGFAEVKTSAEPEVSILVSPGINDIERDIKSVKIVDELDIKVDDPIIANMKWNRWTNGNFVILGLDDRQAKYLAENIEYIKRWVYNRWGFDNFNLVTECRIVCVDNKEWFKRFFNIDKSQSEIHYDEQGKPILMVIFYCLDDVPSKTVPGPLTHMCLLNMDATNGNTTPKWFMIGSQELNKSLPYIKGKMLELGDLLEKNNPLYFSQGLLETTYDEYSKLSDEDRNKFDLSATSFLLMLRQEFGQQKVLDFYKQCALGKNAQEALKSIFDFQNYEVTDKYFKKYMVKTIDGLKNDKITEKYLQINPD